MAATHVRRASGRATAAAWGVPFVMGLLLTLLGVVALGAATVTGLASIVLYGLLLLASGVLEIVYAFRVRREGNFLLYFLAGVLSVIVGGLFLAQPGVGLASVTLLLAGFFFANGFFRGLTSVLDRYSNWGWDLLYGVVSVALGVVIFAQWPISALWVVGTLVGVEIIVRGVSLIAASLAARRVLRPVPA